MPTTKPTLILIGGRKQQGKNTTADIISILLSNNEIPNTKLAFASKPKQEFCQMYGISLVELEANKEFWRSPLQFYCNEYRRQYLRNDVVWVRFVEADIKLFLQFFPKAVCIITDWRHVIEPIELEKNYTVIKLWVERDNNSVKDTHSSENQIDKSMANYVVKNNGSIGQLENGLYTILRASKIL